MPLFAAVCLYHILPIFATLKLRQSKICSTLSCFLVVLPFANVARIFFNFVPLSDPVCHNICAIGKKQQKKRLPLLAIGDDWHAAAAALLIRNLL